MNAGPQIARTAGRMARAVATRRKRLGRGCASSASPSGASASGASASGGGGGGEAGRSVVPGHARFAISSMQTM